MNIKSIVLAYSPSFLRLAFDRINSSPIGSRLARGVFWSMAGAVIARGLMLCATVLVARMLGKEIYGELGIIQSTVGMFGILAGFGLGTTATKYVAEFREKDPAKASRILALSMLVALVTGGLMSIALFSLAPWLAAKTLAAPHLTSSLRIGALLLLFSAFNGAQAGALAGFEAFRAIAARSCWAGLASFPLMVGGAYLAGLNGAVWGLVGSMAVNWGLNQVALRGEAAKAGISMSFAGCTREFSVLWQFALPAALSGAMGGPVMWACNAMLVNQPEGYGEMGIFTAALTFQAFLLFASGMLNAPLLSMVSNAGANISEKLGTVNILSTWILGVVFAIPLLCFPEIAQVLFGVDFYTRSFTVTFSIVVFYTTVMMFAAGMARVLVAKSLLWWGFFSNAFWAIILIGSAAFLIQWGAPGLAASFAIAYVLSTVIFFPLYYSRKLVPKGTLLSIKSVSIWFVLGGLVVLNIANVPLLFRGLAFAPSVLIAVIAFMRIAKGATAAKETIT